MSKLNRRKSQQHLHFKTWPPQLSTFGWTHVREIVQRYTELCWWKFYGELLIWNKYIPWCDEMWCLPWCDESPGDAGHRLHQLLLNPHRYWPTEPLIKLTLLQMSPFHFHWACLIFFYLTSVITLVLSAHFIVFIRSRERSLSVWSNHRCVGGAAAAREHHIAGGVFFKKAPSGGGEGGWWGGWPGGRRLGQGGVFSPVESWKHSSAANFMRDYMLELICGSQCLCLELSIVVVDAA